MRDIIDLLFDNPILLILLVTWLLSAVGGVFTRAARKAEEQRRRALQEQRGREPGTRPRPLAQPPAQPRAERRPTVQEWPEQEQRWPEQEQRWPEQQQRWPEPQKPRPQPQPVRGTRPARPRPLTPEEAAEEIRRLMGMEPEPGAASREPERREARAEPRTLRGLGDVRRRHIELHIDPHVGEELHDRRFARRRSSLQRQETPEPAAQAPPRRASELSELRNLPKALVLREILGPPKALQGEWQW